jgi:hypothetical protein
VINVFGLLRNDRASVIYALRRVLETTTVRAVGCALRLAIKESFAFLGSRDVEAVGVTNDAPVTSESSMLESAHFAHALVILARLKGLKGTVLRAFIVEPLSVVAPGRVAVAVVRPPAKR